MRATCKLIFVFVPAAIKNPFPCYSTDSAPPDDLTSRTFPPQGSYFLQRAVAQHWAKVHFGSLQVETVAGQHVFQLPVYLNEMEPEAVQVELSKRQVSMATHVQQLAAQSFAVAPGAKKTSVRASMLSRAGAVGSVVGSSNAVWAVNRARPSSIES